MAHEGKFKIWSWGWLRTGHQFSGTGSKQEGKWIPVSTPFKFASTVAWRWQIQSSDSVAPAIAKRSAVGQKSSSPLLSSCSNTVATADFFGQPLANTSLFLALKIKNSCLFGRNIVIFGRQDRPSVQRQGRQWKQVDFSWGAHLGVKDGSLP